MEEGVFPHSRSLFDEAEMEEERRLAYVGITRAKERLYLTSARMRTLFGRTNVNAPSRFLKEIPSELLEGNLPEERGYGQRDGFAFGQREGGYRPFGAGAGSSGFSRNGKAGTAPQTAGAAASASPFSRTAQQAGTRLPGHGGGAGIDWKVGEKVKHGKWGIGTVVKVKGADENMELDIAFPSPVGIKKLLAKFAPIERA
jgi:DNA helicase-2/ATP-dependent DNA helicase PcrA